MTKYFLNHTHFIDNKLSTDNELFLCTQFCKSLTENSALDYPKKHYYTY